MKSFFKSLLLTSGVVSLAGAASAAPLSLDDAIALALKRNPSVRVQEYSRDTARAGVLTAYGKFDPALTFRRSYSEDGTPASGNPLQKYLTKTDDYSLGLEGTSPWGMNYHLGATGQNLRLPSQYQDHYATFAGLTITQPLLKGFGFGSNLADLRIAKANRSIADWDFRQTAIDTVTNVILTYNDLVEAEENLRITKRYRDDVASILTDNEKRYRVGSIAANDVTQARARVADLDESVLFAERNLFDVANRLRSLIGETTFPKDAALETQALENKPVDLIEGAPALSKALASRPDYQSAKLGITKSKATLSQAWNQRLPQVDFVGSVGYSGLDSDFAASRRQVRNEDNRSYSAGVVVSVPLTFAESRGRARAARAGMRQSEAYAVKLEADIAVSVTNAFGQIETARKRVKVLKSAFELAQQSLEAEIKRLRAGTGDTFFVLQKQAELASIESRQSRALADERRAIANYERELGVTLEAHQIAFQ